MWRTVEGGLERNIELLVKAATPVYRLRGTDPDRFIRSVGSRLEVLNAERLNDLVEPFESLFAFNARRPTLRRTANGEYWSFTYNPSQNVRDAPSSVVGLARAPHEVFTLKGRSTIGLDRSLGTTGTVATRDSPVTHADAEGLAAAFLLTLPSRTRAAP